MRQPIFRLLILLLAWCVGFQSTTSAMGMRCAHGSMATMDEGSMPPGMHHGNAASMDHAAAPSAHASHHAGADAMTTAEGKTGIATLGCQCGCNCASLGCVGSGPGIASLNSSRFFLNAPAAFALRQAHAGLRSAHGLDLIRPPSKF